MIPQVRKFFHLNSQEKGIFLYCWFLMGWTRFAILTMPFKRLVSELSHHCDPVEPVQVKPGQRERAARYGWIVASAARYTPWQSLCLVQVLTLQKLLSKQGIPGQFYLGVQTGNAERVGSASLTAHAWLQCGDVIINGGQGSDRFTVVSTFSWGTQNA